MLSFIFLFLAAGFNSIMDTLLWHFPISVFKDLNQEWWNPSISWQYVPNFLGWMRFDAWHISKMLMLIFIVLAIYCYSPVLGHWDIIVMPVIWFISFEIFFRILRK